MREHHLSQTRRNYRLFGELRETYVDWAVTVLFYGAIHFIEAWLLERVPTGSGSHQAMANRLTRLGVPSDVYDAHEYLRELSETARYRRWTAVLRNDVLTSVHDTAYRRLCEFFGAPDDVRPDEVPSRPIPRSPQAARSSRTPRRSRR